LLTRNPALGIAPGVGDGSLEGEVKGVQVTIADGRISTRNGAHAGTLGLTILGVVVTLLGAAWWAFDADPTRGKILLVLGVILAVGGRFVGHRLSRRGQRVLLVAVSVAALLVLVDAVHLIQVVNDQRASHAA
jgi:hypothetical protein